MRKNGVNSNLLPIAGGVCAPAGFKANGIASGIRADGSKDLALIYAEKRCPTAGVFSQCNPVGSPVKISKKHLKNGYAHAIIINSGIANVFLPNGDKIADRECQLVEKYCCVIKEDILVASTGEIGLTLPIEPFEMGIKRLAEGLGVNDMNSYAAAQAIASVGEVPKQLSFSFDIGDISCKIGAIFKGSARVCPNMATTLVFLTTDVCITPEMLQKALSAEVKETLNLLSIDGEPSPNDTVCIMANGRAGNWRIDCADTEYKKFTFALRSVLSCICKELIRNTEGVTKTLCCKVSGSRSKQVSRALAKRLAGAKNILDGIKEKNLKIEDVFYLLAEEGAMEDALSVRISLQSAKGVLTLYEDGVKLPYVQSTGEEILSASDVWLCVDLGKGNYQSIGYGCIW